MVIFPKSMAGVPLAQPKIRYYMVINISCPGMPGATYYIVIFPKLTSRPGVPLAQPKCKCLLYSHFPKINIRYPGTPGAPINTYCMGISPKINITCSLAEREIRERKRERKRRQRGDRDPAERTREREERGRESVCV